MKIAILTQPLGHNYGGILQNYALQQVLIKLGHEPITFEKDYRQNISLLKFILELPKRIITKYLFKKREFILSEKQYNIHYKKIWKQLFPFVINYINHIYVKNYVSINLEMYNAFIVGSDQVWRPRYNNGNLDSMYLSFIPQNVNVKRIAYGASFGTCKWEYSEEQTYESKILVKNFDAVSVREIDGVSLCQRFLNRDDALNVLDPTLLLEKEDYLKLCADISERENLLFAYILDVDNESKSILMNIAEKFGLQLILVGAEECCTLTVEEWIAMFRDAKMVITDSFHGTIFSIIFNKEFYSISNQSRGRSRFESLLSQFNLSNRLYDNILDIELTLGLINWDEVEANKRLKQKVSTDFLIKNLS